MGRVYVRTQKILYYFCRLVCRDCLEANLGKDLYHDAVELRCRRADDVERYKAEAKNLFCPFCGRKELYVEANWKEEFEVLHVDIPSPSGDKYAHDMVYHERGDRDDY